LGGDQIITSVSVEWPSGARQQFKNVAANQFLMIDESAGIVK
jgi:hypothetical protein